MSGCISDPVPSLILWFFDSRGMLPLCRKLVLIANPTLQGATMSMMCRFQIGLMILWRVGSKKKRT